jgi:hypothetical protein
MTQDRLEVTLDRTRAIDAEAHAVVASGRALSPGWLEEAAAWLGESAPSWEELTGVVPLERTYRRVIATPRLEAWLICWPTDVHLQLHDHGGASGALQVVDGTLDERSLIVRGGLSGPGAILHDRLVETGEVVSFDGSYIHDVRNTHRHAATSIPMYGAADRPMSFYRLDGGLVRTVGPLSEHALRQDSLAPCGAEVAGGGRRPVSA